MALLGLILFFLPLQLLVEVMEQGWLERLAVQAVQAAVDVKAAQAVRGLLDKVLLEVEVRLVARIHPVAVEALDQRLFISALDRRQVLGLQPQ